MGKCSCCSYEQNAHKDFIRGGVEGSDFDDDLRYRHPKRRSRKARLRATRKVARGCPGNEQGAHVYVWTTKTDALDIFFEFYNWHKEEYSVCVGCERYDSKRETERYHKIKERKYKKIYGGAEDVLRGAPVGRGFRRYKDSFWAFKWERHDPEYREFYNKEIIRKGYPTYLLLK